jgi:hypothetical protein
MDAGKFQLRGPDSGRSAMTGSASGGFRTVVPRAIDRAMTDTAPAEQKRLALLGRLGTWRPQSPSPLSCSSERPERPLRWSAPGGRTRGRLVIPTRRSTPGGTKDAHPYVATAAARPAARMHDILARIVSGARRAIRTWTRLFPLPSPPWRARTPAPSLARLRTTRRGRLSARFIDVEAAPAGPTIGRLQRAALAPSPPPASVRSRPGPTFEGGPGGLPLPPLPPFAPALGERRPGLVDPKVLDVHGRPMSPRRSEKSGAASRTPW